MELDQVIDQMIAERVIHRHRRKWIVLFVVLFVGIAVVWFLDGWDAPDRSTVKVVRAPYTVQAGRFEFLIDSATLTKTPKGKYVDAKAELTVRMGIKNTDSETKASDSVRGDLFYLGQNKGDPIASNGATCNGDLNYKLVYGLPTQDCTVRFEVPPDYSDTAVRLVVLNEEYRSDSSVIGASDQPYWHDGHVEVVVEMTAEQAVGK